MSVRFTLCLTMYSLLSSASAQGATQINPECNNLQSRYWTASRRWDFATEEIYRAQCPEDDLEAQAIDESEQGKRCREMRNHRSFLFELMENLQNSFKTLLCRGEILPAPGEWEKYRTLGGCYSHCSYQDYETGNCHTCSGKMTVNGVVQTPYSVDCRTKADALTTLRDGCGFLSDGKFSCEVDYLSCRKAGALSPEETSKTNKEGYFHIDTVKSEVSEQSYGLTLFFPLNLVLGGAAGATAFVSVHYVDVTMIHIEGTPGTFGVGVRGDSTVILPEAKVLCRVERKVSHVQGQSASVDIAGNGGSTLSSFQSGITVGEKWTISGAGMTVLMARDACLREVRASQAVLKRKADEYFATFGFTGNERIHECYNDPHCQSDGNYRECRESTKGNVCFAPSLQGQSCLQWSTVTIDPNGTGPIPMFDDTRCARGLRCVRQDSPFAFWQAVRATCEPIPAPSPLPTSNWYSSFATLDTTYQILSYWQPNGTELALDQHLGSSEMGQGFIYAHPSHGNLNQQFRFWKVGTNELGEAYGYISSATDGRCLDVHTSERIGNGYRTYLNLNCHGGANQLFRLANDWTIRDHHFGYCLDLNWGSRFGNGYNVYSHPCHGQSNQQWWWRKHSP